MLFRSSARKGVDEYAEATGTMPSPEARKEFLRVVESGDYNVKVNNAHHLKFMTETMGVGGPGFTNMFFGQRWRIYIAKGRKRFITSDTPVIEWWNPPESFYGASFLERNKYFALTPKILIELTWPVGSEKVRRKTLFESDDNVVAMFNILLASRSHEFAYTGDRGILEDLLSGRTTPGPTEAAYYERFERPWQEYRNRTGDMT